MDAKLYQEQSDIGHGGGPDVLTPLVTKPYSDMSVEERVAEVRRLIMREVSSGRFELTPLDCLSYQNATTGECVGCALGALALSLSGRPEPYQPGEQPFLRNRRIKEEGVRRGLLSEREALSMEVGYEHGVAYGKGYDVSFFELGLELRALRPAASY